MQILLDEKPCELDALAPESVGEAVAAGSDVARKHGRLIVEVVVDGQVWSAEQLDNDELIQSGADEVRMISAKPGDLASSVFADAGAVLDGVEQHQTRAAEMIQAGQTDEGLREFNEALTLWVSVQQAVEQASELISIDLDTAEFGDGGSATEVLASLQQQLENIREQLRNQDLLGVADSLLYDLPAVLGQWRELLDHLSAEVSGDSH